MPGPTRINERFDRLRRRRESALVAYFPLDVGESPRALAAVYAEARVDVIELGLPAQDPFLDGPTIRESMRRAQALGWGTNRYFEAIAEIRAAQPELIVQVFAYDEAMRRLGAGAFVRGCIDAGADALLVIGEDEAGRREIDALCGNALASIRFAAHGADDDALRRLAESAPGYLFMQSLDGPTGVRQSLAQDLPAAIRRLRARVPDRPVCVGFGVSTPEHARTLRAWGADGVVVGSAVVRQLGGGSAAELRAAGRYLSDMKAALRPPVRER